MIEHLITSINTSKYVSGIIMILMNLGSKYIAEELSEAQDNIFSNKIMRGLLIFSIVFFATKDVKISLILTSSFIIIVNGLLNEDSSFYIFNKKEHFTNKPTKHDYLIAKKIIKQYENKKI